MSFSFYKIHGTGNDFIMVDNRDSVFPDESVSFIKKICRPHTGISAEGLLLLENSAVADFKMRYFNSDGKESEMCVNGSRCICYLAYLLKIIDKKHSFEAGDGVHYSEIVGKEKVRVEVLFRKENDSRTFPVDFNLPNSISFVQFLNTGVPHLVLACENIDNIRVHDLGSKLRFDPYYAPEGTNVNFVEYISSDSQLVLKVRTFERGVDAETLSCGSGVTAAAISFFPHFKPNSREVKIITQGGQLLVTLSDELNSIYLEGPVKIIFKGRYIEEDSQ